MTSLLAVSAISNKPFNSDFYIAVDTVMPVLLIATGVISVFVNPEPRHVERRDVESRGTQVRPRRRNARFIAATASVMAIAYVATTAGAILLATLALQAQSTNEALAEWTSLLFFISLGLVTLAVWFVLDISIRETYERRIAELRRVQPKSRFVRKRSPIRRLSSSRTVRPQFNIEAQILRQSRSSHRRAASSEADSISQPRRGTGDFTRVRAF